MISAYLTAVQHALDANRQQWFPLEETMRRERNLRLGRELGYGLAICDEWEDYAKGTYGRLIVRSSLDTIGVVISNQEWMDSIREGIRKHNQIGAFVNA